MSDSDRIALLERQQALQTEALRRIIEGHWTGAVGAAAQVVALMGGATPTDFAPIDCPKADPPQPQLS